MCLCLWLQLIAPPIRYHTKAYWKFVSNANSSILARMPRWNRRNSWQCRGGLSRIFPRQRRPASLLCISHSLPWRGTLQCGLEIRGWALEWHPIHPRLACWIVVRNLKSHTIFQPALRRGLIVLHTLSGSKACLLWSTARKFRVTYPCGDQIACSKLWIAGKSCSDAQSCHPWPTASPLV